jgi:protein-S-isoprenylcysteine O-methyltransferase Ste14
MKIEGGAGIAAANMRSALWLDLAERGFLLMLGSWMLYRFAPTVAGNPLNLLILVSEGLVLAFALFRRFGPAVNTARAWSVALIGTCAPLLIVPAGSHWMSPSVVLPFMLLGILISTAAKLSLRRSFGIVAANRGVRRGGPYRLVRHPMYSGYLLTHASFLVVNASLWNAAVYACCWMAMLLRIGAEEGILGVDPAYRAYGEQVRYRLIPGLW